MFSRFACLLNPSRPLRAFSQAVLSASLALSLTLPVFATLDQTLAPFPAQTPVLVTLSLSPTHWRTLINGIKDSKGLNLKTEFPTADGQTRTLEQSLPPEALRLIDFLHKDLKFDPVLDGLLNLGSHLSLAYKPDAGTDGQMLFSLNLRSPDRVQALVGRLRDALTARQGRFNISEAAFGPQIIYTLTIKPDAKEQRAAEAAPPPKLSFAIAGSNLIGTVGETDRQLKQMIYAEALLSPHSPHRLSSQAGFKAVREQMQDQAAWAYVDIANVVKAMTRDQDIADGELGLMMQALGLSHNAGLGMTLDDQSLNFKGFVAPDWANLTPAQRDYLEAMQTKPAHELTALVEHMPGDPVFLSGSQHLDLLLTKPLPVELTENIRTDLDSIAKEIGQSIEQVVNLDYQQDFVPMIDGRYGFGVFESAQKGELPHMVLYLGLKDGQEAAFDKVMQQKFRFRPEALKGSSASPVRANLHTLQTITETYGVDWGGMYPKDLATLQKEASVESRDYWKDVKNPVSGETGLNQSIADYSQFKGTADQIGMIFYEPVGEPVSDEDGTFYAGYKLYAYLPEGQLVSVENDGYEFVTEREDLPTVQVNSQTEAEPASTIMPTLVETFQGTPIYALNLKPLLEKEMGSLDRQSEQVQANMQALRTAAETFAVDWLGQYPQDLASLYKEASAEGGDYWRELTNPVSQNSELGQTIADYSQFKGTVDQVGMIFYEPLGKELVDEEGGRFREAYAVYGYAANGTLYRQASENSDNSGPVELKAVRTDLPVSPSYQSPLDDPLLTLAPAYARKGNVWMMAPNASILKTALAGGQPARLNHWIDGTGSRDAESLFYLDAKRAATLLRQQLGEELSQDKELAMLLSPEGSWLEPLRAIFGMSRTLPHQGTQSRLAIELDYAKIQGRELAGQALTVLTELPQAEERAKLSSVKANMHTFQTIVETYAVDWGGYYGPDVATIKSEAVLPGRDYWKELANPYLGEGTPTLADYKDYQPGPASAGMVFYDPIPGEDGQIARYWIYGTDNEGQLIQDKGQTFVLTNS